MLYIMLSNYQTFLSLQCQTPLFYILENDEEGRSFQLFCLKRTILSFYQGTIPPYFYPSFQNCVSTLPFFLVDGFYVLCVYWFYLRKYYKIDVLRLMSSSENMRNSNVDLFLEFARKKKKKSFKLQ